MRFEDLLMDLLDSKRQGDTESKAVRERSVSCSHKRALGFRHMQILKYSTITQGNRRRESSEYPGMITSHNEQDAIFPHFGAFGEDRWTWRIRTSQTSNFKRLQQTPVSWGEMGWDEMGWGEMG